MELGILSFELFSAYACDFEFLNFEFGVLSFEL